MRLRRVDGSLPLQKFEMFDNVRRQLSTSRMTARLLAQTDGAPEEGSSGPCSPPRGSFILQDAIDNAVEQQALNLSFRG